LAMHVIKTEGAGALFAGTIPRCAKVAPACGLMIACYEGVGRWLGGEGEQV
jgi:solute carrier family 25 protein 39/40